MAEFAEMIENDYGIKRKGNTVQNPQANAILERVHQTIENITRSFSKESMDEENPTFSRNDVCNWSYLPHHTASYTNAACVWT
jgi:hypothetical protein